MACLICTSSDLQNRHFCTEETTISRKPLISIIGNVLRLSQIDLNSEICHLCFDLLDEIDAFEHSLLRAKQKLEDRYVSSDLKTHIEHFGANVDSEFMSKTEPEKHENSNSEEIEDNAEENGNSDGCSEFSDEKDPSETSSEPFRPWATKKQ